MENNVNKINYDEIIHLIRDQLLVIVEENYAYYGEYKIIISEEQFFIKPSQVDPKAIYIVLKFSPISVHFGQTVVPVQIRASSEENNIEVCRNLFADLVSKHNLDKNEDSTIQQIYESPVVNSSFNKVTTGFRALISVSATFVVSKNANFYKYYYCYYASAENKIETNLTSEDVINIKLDDFNVDADAFINFLKESNFTLERKSYFVSRKREGQQGEFLVYYFNDIECPLGDLEEFVQISDNVKNSTVGNFSLEIKVLSFIDWREDELPCVTKAFSGSMQLDTQPFFGSNNLTKSEGKVYTLTYSIVTFLLKDIQLVNDVIDVMCQKRGPFEKFKLKIEFNNGNFLEKDFTLVSWDSRTDIGEIPMLTLSFTS